MGRLPNFVIIGAGKSASTWLHLALRQHPEIFMPVGETPFFEDPYYVENDLTALYSELSRAPEGALVGIKRPNYLCLRECPPRIARHVPQARLIAILRNPVDRAVSQYYHLVRSGRLPVMPPDAAFARYLAGSFDAPFVEQFILEFGLYAGGIVEYRRVFAEQQMLVLTDLDMRRGSIGVFQRVCRFLEVADDITPAGISRPRNQGVYSSPILSLIQSMNNRGHTFDARTGSETLREDLIGKAARRLAVLGSRLSGAARIFVRDQEPPISNLTRAKLLEFYMPDIVKLEAMIDEDLSAWKVLPDA